MRIDIVTLFPELCDSFLSASILGRARAKNLFEAHCHQIRDYTKNKQKSRPTTIPTAAAAAWCSTPSPSPTACGLCRPSAPGRGGKSPTSCS